MTLRKMYIALIDNIQQGGDKNEQKKKLYTANPVRLKKIFQISSVKSICDITEQVIFGLLLSLL